MTPRLFVNGVGGEIITVLALGLAGMSIVSAQRNEKSLYDSLENAYLADQVIGRAVGLADIVKDGSQDGEAGRPMLAWILDVDSCGGCLIDVAPWRKLEEDLPDHDIVLFLVGTPTPNVDATLRSLQRTNVVHTTSAQIEDKVGRVLSNTKMLLDDSGIVVLFDSRSHASPCAWSFEAQLGALKGLNSAALIRSPTIPPLVLLPQPQSEQ